MQLVVFVPDSSCLRPPYTFALSCPFDVLVDEVQCTRFFINVCDVLSKDSLPMSGSQDLLLCVSYVFYSSVFRSTSLTSALSTFCVGTKSGCECSS